MRTPTAHRDIVAEIAKTFPEHDSQLFNYGRSDETTSRHRHLAADLRPLLTWLRLAEACPDYEPANDNQKPALNSDDVLDVIPANDNRSAEITASGFDAYPGDGPRDFGAPRRSLRYLEDKLGAEDLIARHAANDGRMIDVSVVINGRTLTGQIRGADAEFTQASRAGKHDQSFGNVRVFGREQDDAKDASAAKAYDIGEAEARKLQAEDDKASREHMRALMPGRLPGRGVRMRAHRQAYRETDRAASLATIAEYGLGGSISLAEARQRHGLPPAANDNTPGYPHWPRDPRKLFHSCQIKGNETASKGGEFQDGITGRLAQQQESAYLRGRLSKDTVAVLDATLVADNFREIGERFGHTGKPAERHGQRLVRDACAALAEKIDDLENRSR